MISERGEERDGVRKGLGKGGLRRKGMGREGKGTMEGKGVDEA